MCESFESAGERKVSEYFSYFLVSVKVGCDGVGGDLVNQRVVFMDLCCVCDVFCGYRRGLDAYEVVDGVSQFVGKSGAKAGGWKRKVCGKVRVLELLICGRLISVIVDVGFVGVLDGLSGIELWVMEKTVFDRLVGAYGLGWFGVSLVVVVIEFGVREGGRIGRLALDRWMQFVRIRRGLGYLEYWAGRLGPDFVCRIFLARSGFSQVLVGGSFVGVTSYRPVCYSDVLVPFVRSIILLIDWCLCFGEIWDHIVVIGKFDCGVFSEFLVILRRFVDLSFLILSVFSGLYS